MTFNQSNHRIIYLIMKSTNMETAIVFRKSDFRWLELLMLKLVSGGEDFIIILFYAFSCIHRPLGHNVLRTTGFYPLDSISVKHAWAIEASMDFHAVVRGHQCGTFYDYYDCHLWETSMSSASINIVSMAWCTCVSAHWGRDKLQQFRWRYCHMCFLDRKCLNFAYDFTRVCS